MRKKDANDIDTIEEEIKILDKELHPMKHIFKEQPKPSLLERCVNNFMPFGLVIIALVGMTAALFIPESTLNPKQGTKVEPKVEAKVEPKVEPIKELTPAEKIQQEVTTAEDKLVNELHQLIAARIKDAASKGNKELAINFAEDYKNYPVSMADLVAKKLNKDGFYAATSCHETCRTIKIYWDGSNWFSHNWGWCLIGGFLAFMFFTVVFVFD